MIVPAFHVHLGFGALLVVFSVPLVLRWVPMNRAYGIRVAEAFSSEARWYDINAYGGRIFLVYGFLLIGFALATRDLAPPATSLWSPVFHGAPMIGVLLLLPLIRAYARRRQREGP